jgi:Protein of unknown function (DUF4238)
VIFCEGPILMVAPKKERHHYVPVFYLQGFRDSGDASRVWQYDKQTLSVRSISVRDAALEKHYYSFVDEDGKRDSATIENELEKVENVCAPIHRKLLSATPLTNEERSEFAVFMGLMMTRAPVLRLNYERMAAEVVKRLTQSRARAGAFDDILSEGPQEVADILRGAIDRGDFDVDVLPQISLDVIPLATTFGHIIEQMCWVLLEVRGGRYRLVTSDNPLVYSDPSHDSSSPYGYGLNSPNVEVTFPLSLNVVLVCGWRASHNGKLFRRSASEAKVAMINKRTIADAQRFVYASEQSEGLLKIVRRCAETAPRLRFD